MYIVMTLEEFHKHPRFAIMKYKTHINIKVLVIQCLMEYKSVNDPMIKGSPADE